MDGNVKTKEPIKIALFKSLLNVAFNLIKWKILGNQHELVLSKEYNLISMYVNPQTQMFSLKITGNKDIMTMDASKVDAIVLSKDNLTIIGDFNNGCETDKKDNITIS